MDHLNVHLLPSRVAPESLAGRTVVVIDVLRATTTIAFALEAGAREVIPCGEIDEAWGIKRCDPQVLLGGERGGSPIDGFDLGNSPQEYTPERVAGRRLAFTTTNGTQAMLRCRQAGRVLLGAFVNLTALVNSLEHEPSIDLLCAGTRGAVSREDSLLAGAVVDRLERLVSGTIRLSDEAAVARDAWRTVSTADIGRLAETLRAGAGGRNLMALGLDRDIEAAAGIDTLRLVPQLDIPNWRIQPAAQTANGRVSRTR